MSRLYVLVEPDGRVRARARAVALAQPKEGWFWDIYAAPEQRDAARAAWRSLRDGPIELTTDVATRGGDTLAVVWSLIPIHRDDGTIELVIAEGAPRGVEHEPHRPEGTCVAEERLRMLIEAMPDPVFFKDEAGRWQIVNPAALEAFEVTGDYRGKTDLDLSREADFMKPAFEYCAGTDEDAWARCGISRSDEQLPRRDGSVHVYDTYKIPLFHADGRRKGLIVLGRDVTDRQRAEEILRTSERQLRSILAAMLDAIFLFDAERRITFLNPAAERMLGVPSAEVVGKTWDSGPWRAELPNGDALPPDIGERVQSLRGIEIALVRQDASRVVASMNAAPLVEPPGAFVVAAQDITQRSELAALKTAFLQIAAHELRTPLTPLRLLLQRTAGRVARGESVSEEVIVRMQRQTDRLITLVNELVDLVRLEQGVLPITRECTDLAALTSSIVEGYREEVPGRQLSLSLPASPEQALLAEIDPARIEQVIDSLIDNAIKYSSGPIEVRVEAEEQTLRVDVCDRGRGIAPNDEAGIFSRFYRARAAETTQHGGLGLGLALSRETARQHGGELSYRARTGGGSVFSLTLPRHQAEAAPTSTQVAVRNNHGEVMMAFQPQESDDKFYARAQRRLREALGEAPTPDEIRRLDEDARYAFERAEYARGRLRAAESGGYDREYERGEPPPLGPRGRDDRSMMARRR